MGLFSKKAKADLEAVPEGGAVAHPRGAYELDDHMISPAEVAERYGTVIDWKNIGGSKGLSSQQVNML